MKQKQKFSPAIPNWIRKPQMPCPCGSQRSFLYCCKPNLKQYPSGAFYDAFESKNFNLALKITRADLTAYLENVYRHTIPMLQQGVSFPLPLVPIDINAIAEITENIARCFEAQEKNGEIEALYKHVEKMAPLPGMSERLFALKISRMAWGCDQEAEAKKLLREYKEKNEIRDVVLLQVYLDLFDEEIGFHEQVQMIDRIIAQCLHGRDQFELFHYRMLKSLFFYWVGDKEGALKGLDEAIKKLKKPEVDTGSYGLRVLAMARKLRWYINQDKDDLQKSIELNKKLLGQNLNARGTAEVYAELGVLHILEDKLEIGIEYLDLAISHEENPRFLILKADTYLKLNDVKKTIAVMDSLVLEKLPKNRLLDYWTVKTAIALINKDKKLAGIAIEQLKTLNIKEPYFQKRRDSLVISLLESMSAKADTSKEASKKSPSIMGKIRGLSDFLILEPNFLGFGLNLNKVIEKLTNKKD